MANELLQQRKAWSVLIVSTVAFTVCFMVWMMFGVIGVPIKKMLSICLQLKTWELNHLI